MAIYRLVRDGVFEPDRWEFYPAPQGGLAYRLDRWTGRVVAAGLCSGWEFETPKQ
jgi:hypothetical protein